MLLPILAILAFVLTLGAMMNPPANQPRVPLSVAVLILCIWALVESIGPARLLR